MLDLVIKIVSCHNLDTQTHEAGSLDGRGAVIITGLAALPDL